MPSPAPLGVQLFSVREALAADLPGTLTALAEIGYAGIEPYRGVPDHKQAAALAKELGMQVPSGHMPLPIDENEKSALETAALYGLERLILPWLPQEDFTDKDTINRGAQVAAANGLKLAYHNHDAEFTRTDDWYPYQVMLEHLDPSVAFQVDTYWVQVGGPDPAAVLTELGDRAPSIHIKDGPAQKGVAQLALGSGVIDIPAIIKASQGHADWVIVELDDCDTDMLAALRESYTYMTQEGLGRGRAG